MNDLTQQAENLLRQLSLVPPREAGESLRWQDKARILALRNDGKTQEEIALEIGCHQSTVSRTLAELDDSRPFARKMLEANAVRIVEDILDHLKEASMADKVKLLGKLDVVREDKADLERGGVTVIVAVPGSDANPRPSIALSPVNVNDAPSLSANAPGPGTRR